MKTSNLGLALFAFSFLFTNGVSAQNTIKIGQTIQLRTKNNNTPKPDIVNNTTDNKPAPVNIATPIKHRVRRGEGLYRIARRYNVTVNEILSEKINPQLARRGNPDRLYRGEVINIPLYQVTTLAEAKPDDLIVVGALELMALKSLLKNRMLGETAELVGLRQSLAIAKKWIILGGLTLVAMLVLVIMLLDRVTRKNNNEGAGLDTSKPTRIPETTTEEIQALGPRTPEDFLEILQTADGRTLYELANLTLVTDEHGNPVTIKKIRDFLPKREYLNYVPVTRWNDAMRTHEGLLDNQRVPGVALAE